MSDQFNQSFFKIFFSKILFLSNVSTHCGAWTNNQEIKSQRLPWLVREKSIFEFI